ncbi:MAG TPA: CHAT domain-containing protein [Pyrinomonadaceae bacterium]|nr:CHAT domain-containing protein [Pyrinomonadaceae bacterium]
MRITQQTTSQERSAFRAQERIIGKLLLTEAAKLKAEDRLDSTYEALEKLKEAALKFKSAKDWQALLEVLRGTGHLHQRLNESQKAYTSLYKALALSQQLKLVDVEIELLNDLGQMAVELGDDSRALTQAGRAYTLSERAFNKSGMARSLHIIGDVHYNRGKLQESLASYQDSLRLFRETNDPRGEIRTLVSFGYAFLDLSEQEKALDSYHQALSLSRVEGDRHLEAITLRALGNLQTKLGENQKAIDYFLTALSISQSLVDQHLNAIVLAGLGYAYSEIGEKQRALQYYSRALRIFTAINHRWGEAETRMDAAGVHYFLGNNHEAMDNYTRALVLFQALRMPRYQAQTLRDMGLVYDSMGEKSKALYSLKRALILTRKGQDQRYEAYTLNYLGKTYERAGEKEKARSCYQRALPLNRIASDPAGESLTLFNLAHLERDLGNLPKALVWIEGAHEIIESLRTKSMSPDLRAAYFATVRRHYELYIDILMQLHQKAPAEKFNARAFKESENARARSLLESLNESRAEIREGVNSALLERERSLQRTLNLKAEQYLQLKSGGKATDEGELVAREIDRITIEFDEVKAQIRAQSPHYAALTQPQPLTLDEIQEVLDDNTLLLEYMLSDDRSYIWVVSNREVFSYELRGRTEIENQVRNVTSLITANQPLPGETFEETQARSARASEQLPFQVATLSRLLLWPLSSKLGTKRLLIVPDGALQYVPFQVLTLPPQGSTGEFDMTAKSRPLVLDHEIINEPSASALALLIGESKNRQPPRNSVAVLADPVFEADDPRIPNGGQPVAISISAESRETELHRAMRDVNLSGGGNHIPRLQASRDEARAIMSVTPWGSGFEATGFEASRATATNTNLGEYRIVHFATHGLLNNEHPELSGIVLSLFDQKGQPQDGFLRLHDIYNLKLPVDLVVLSACNTGLGKDVRGEGLIGLTRGFMYAGASSVVASLWKVDDEATAQLMRLFYGYMLRDGLSPSAALRKAQVSMSQHKRWQSPYYWAGFVIQGEYLSKGRTSHTPQLVLWLFGAAIAIAAGLYALKRRRKITL